MKVIQLQDKGIRGTVELNNNSLLFKILGQEVQEETPAFLKEIKKINEFDVTTGYIAYEANTGEEYIDLWDLFEKHGLDYQELLRKELSKDTEEVDYKVVVLNDIQVVRVSTDKSTGLSAYDSETNSTDFFKDR